MIIETKFNIGDRFFFLTYTTHRGKVLCKACDGDRVIFLKDQSTIECPKCWGNGYIEEFGVKCWRTERSPLTVASIIIRDEKHEGTTEPTIYYSIKEMTNHFKESDCYKTFEEAKSECKMRNKDVNVVE